MINIGKKSKYVFNARTSSRKSTKIIYKFSMHSRSQCRITGRSMNGVVRISMNTEHLQKQQTVLSAVGSCAGPIMRSNPQPTADVNTLFSTRRVRPDRGTARTDVSVAFLEQLFCGTPLVPYFSGWSMSTCLQLHDSKFSVFIDMRTTLSILRPVMQHCDSECILNL